jgi:matrixin
LISSSASIYLFATNAGGDTRNKNCSVLRHKEPSNMKPTMKILSSLLFVLSVGCSNESVQPFDIERLSFNIDPAFTAQERQIIEESLSDWNAISVPERRLTISPDSIWTIVRHRPLPDAGLWNPKAHTISLINIDEADDMCYKPGQGASAFAMVVRHELGHALGLEHIRSTLFIPGVMVPSQECFSNGINEDDKQECRRVGSCR